MNTDLKSAILLANDIVHLTKVTDTKKVEIAIFVPYPFIRDVKRVVEGSPIKVGAQSTYYESKGAYTGAVSASMLSSIGCDYVLVGHSERRALFGETDMDINCSLKQVISHGMKPVLCVGETREEYELGLNNAICAVQLSRGLGGLNAEEVSNVVIAYEPVRKLHLSILSIFIDCGELMVGITLLMQVQHACNTVALLISLTVLCM